MVVFVLRHVQIAEMSSFSACNPINTPERISDLADSFYNLPREVPALDIDLEGENLGREGTIFILQISVSPRKHTFVIDIRVTLQSVLEASEMTKVFFDVRSNSDALFAHFGIKLDGVRHLQLLEFASREARKSFLGGLAKCIDRDRLHIIKDAGHKLFDPPSGDFQYLPQLWLVYDQKHTPQWRLQVGRESQARIQLFQSTGFNGQGRHMALPPAGLASQFHIRRTTFRLREN
ncbi:hypothetical protein LX32DRAFT_701596 [Colletotrichum zoysiae]|uniref:3'-5' exonuclease domain-containing protein n=1 Tax=Colletotrichum zoysiae TaxID=1216348 RepID=A0AAD9HCQ4_9PEZI|nr:hypothetical protein LX32DRAFT_701596 [Colletotrichum zoysiae]